MKNKNLIIPLYLDTNILIDLLASIEGGFSMMEQVKTKTTETVNTGLKAEAKVSFPNVFDLFKVDLGGNINAGSGNDSEKSQERYYTFGSLLYKLVNILKKDNVIKSYSKELYTQINPGDFIEIRGTIVKNPLINSVKGLIQMADGITLMTQLGEKNAADKNKLLATKHNMGNLKKMFQTFLSGIEKTDEEIYYMNVNEAEKISLYFSIFNSFTRDLSGLEFSDGEFLVLGKVIGKQNNLNLLEKSLFAGFPTKTFDQLLEAFKVFKSQGYNVPDLAVEINNPVIKIIPIAIYC